MIERHPISILFHYSPLFIFFLNDTATTEISPLSLHDALPISLGWALIAAIVSPAGSAAGWLAILGLGALLRGSLLPWVPSRRPRELAVLLAVPAAVLIAMRSEEHTSELQSHSDLVCRLLL